MLRRHGNLLVPGFEEFSTRWIQRVEWVPLKINIAINHSPKSHFGALHADAEIRSVVDEPGALDHGFGETVPAEGLELRNKLVLMVSHVDLFNGRKILQALLTANFRQKMTIN